MTSEMRTMTHSFIHAARIHGTESIDTMLKVERPRIRPSACREVTGTKSTVQIHWDEGFPGGEEHNPVGISQGQGLFVKKHCSKSVYSEWVKWVSRWEDAVFWRHRGKCVATFFNSQGKHATD